MKLVNTFPGSNNWKHINLQLASFAAGLALATAAILGSGEILGGGDTASSPSTTQVAPRYVGVAMAEPGFGDAAADYSAFRSSVSAAPSRYVGVAMAEPGFGDVAADYSVFRSSVSAAPSRYVGVAMAEPGFGDVAADYSAFRQPAATQDTEDGGKSEGSLPVVDTHFGTPLESVSAIEGDHLR